MGFTVDAKRCYGTEGKSFEPDGISTIGTHPVFSFMYSFERESDFTEHATLTVGKAKRELSV